MSATCTSIPLGSSTSVACSWMRHTAAENVSGMALRITRGKERSLRISLPFPAMTTVTPQGCCRTVRPGGMVIASRRAKLCVRGCCAATATYSMLAKNGAASLIGQLRTNSCPRLPRTVIDQSPDQGFVHRTIPLRGADHFLDDHPVAIDHPALGHAGRLIGLLDGGRLVVQDVEAEPQLARERHDHGIVLLVDAHRHYPEIAAPPEPAIQALHRRHLHATRQAPGGPNVEQHDLATVVGERRGASGPQVFGVKRGCGGAHPQQVDLGRDFDGEGGAEHQRHDDADRDRPLARRRHTVTRQRRRRSRTSRAGSPLVKIALPATNVSAPAACAAAMVWDVIPPSTSRKARDPCAASSSRARRILSFEAGRYVCPPNPGFTVMMSTRSTSATTSSASCSGVAGLSATPASIPLLRAAASSRCTCSVASGWKVKTDAPAAANDSS